VRHKTVQLAGFISTQALASRPLLQLNSSAAIAFVTGKKVVRRKPISRIAVCINSLVVDIKV
jgi:hypothetical protein